MENPKPRCGTGHNASKSSKRVGGAIDSEVNSFAESKLGYAGGADSRPWKYHKPFRSEAKKFVYNTCTQLRVAKSTKLRLDMIGNSFKNNRFS